MKRPNSLSPSGRTSTTEGRTDPNKLRPIATSLAWRGMMWAETRPSHFARLFSRVPWSPTFRPFLFGVCILLGMLGVELITNVASATTLSGTIGGAPVPLPDGQILCSDPGGGWQGVQGAKLIRSPTDTAQIGKLTQIRIAESTASCDTSKSFITVVASALLPSIDAHTVDLWVDEGRLELRGTNLDGTRLEWEANGARGNDSCISPVPENGQQRCSFSVSRKLPTDVAASTFHLFPAGASPNASIYDSVGHLVSLETLSLTPVRRIINGSLATENHIDLSTGEDRLSVSHPEAVASVECDVGRCDLVDQAIRIRGITNSARAVVLKIRLSPRAFVRTGETFSQSISLPLEITYCPLSVVSPPPMRDTDDIHLVVRAEGRCGATSESVRWTSNGNPVPVLETEFKDGFVYTLLDIGRVTTERISLAAMRANSDQSIIGFTSTRTAPAPRLRTKLFLPGYGEIDFIPTNREASLSVTQPNLRGKVVALPVGGVYSVKEVNGHTQIQGEAVGGFVVLQFALRDVSLPGHLAKADLAHFTGYVQRAVKEVNIAAPLGRAENKGPIAEVLCTLPTGRSVPVLPGVPYHIPFAQRDGCRLIIHRERIPSEDGEQRLNVNIDVTSLGGTIRTEGHFEQRLLLRHGSEPRIVWIRGVQAQFDRISVRLTHVTDDSQYIRGAGEQLEVPAGQWTIVVENTRWRLYATASIPVQLFRFSNDPGGAGTGPLSLNLGILSRFTWVTQDGAEGIVGLEGGVMGMGLATDNTRQLNVVTGLGLAVPLGNKGQSSQASINIHSWLGYRLGNEFAPQLDGSGNAMPGRLVNLNHWSLIFGPSVSFGNVGFDI